MKKRNIIILTTTITAVVALTVVLPIVITRMNSFELYITDVNPADMGLAEWQEDFDYLFDFVKDNYPYLWVKDRMHELDWLSLRSEFDQMIAEATNNEDFMCVIMQAVTALQNRHTHVLNPARVKSDYINFADSYPLNLIFSEVTNNAANYWQSIYTTCLNRLNPGIFDALIVYDRGNYTIVDGSGSWENLYGYGTLVTHIDGIPIETAIKSCYTKDYFDYDYEREKTYLWRISPHTFGENAEFTLYNATGHQNNVTFNLLPGYSVSPYEYPTPVVSYTKYENESIGYLYVNSFVTPAIEPYFPGVLAFYDEIKDYEHLIIDIRGNTGGYYSAWIDGIVGPLVSESLIHEFYLGYKMTRYMKAFHEQYMTVKVPKSDFDYLPPEVYSENFKLFKAWGNYAPDENNVNFTGEIILLTDNIVYSAAEGFANFCKQTDFATIYGTASGGDGLLLWPIYCVLPNSKIVINLASTLGLDIDGQANEEIRTQPDVYYESAFGNFTELIDYVIQDLEGS
ncbi:MAG: hypothetical protein FK733_14005 [Asgard group archaeon]|nr:hypothetical protein [Asgard group archaeon]